MMHNNNWNDLKYVLAVTRHGSLSGAARELGVNHATVLRHISSFEQQHHVSLFERHKNGYMPTPDCHSMLSHLEQVETGVNNLETAIRNLGNPFSGKVRITSTDTICQYILPKHLARLHNLYPDLEVELSSTNTRLDLAKMDAEITIRPTLSLPEDLVGNHACDLIMEVFGSPEYLANNISPDQKDHHWLGVSDALALSPFKKWETKNKISNIVFRSDTFISLRNAAERGMGLTMLPSFIGNVSPKLIKASQFSDKLTIHLWVASHRDRSGSARIRTLLDYFHDAMVGEKDVFNGRKHLED